MNLEVGFDIIQHCIVPQYFDLLLFSTVEIDMTKTFIFERNTPDYSLQCSILQPFIILFSPPLCCVHSGAKQLSWNGTLKSVSLELILRKLHLILRGDATLP